MLATDSIPLPYFFSEGEKNSRFNAPKIIGIRRVFAEIRFFKVFAKCSHFIKGIENIFVSEISKFCQDSQKSATESDLRHYKMTGKHAVSSPMTQIQRETMQNHPSVPKIGKFSWILTKFQNFRPRFFNQKCEHLAKTLKNHNFMNIHPISIIFGVLEQNFFLCRNKLLVFEYYR